MIANPAPPDPRTIVLFGIPFHDVTMDETLDWIEHLVAVRRPAYLVTANLDFAAQSSTDVELQRILVEAELVVCDGTPLVWASRLTGKPLRERVAGSDLAPRIAARAARHGTRIFLLGGDPDSLAKAARNLQAAYPGLPEVEYYSPPYAALHEFDNEAIVERVRQARPDILLVAFGCPKQEKWIYMHYRALGVPCCIGVGATVDFLAGKVSRAPAWVAKLGVEWIYRLLQEPKRLIGRYAKDLCFLVTQSWREFRVMGVRQESRAAAEEQVPEPVVVPPEAAPEASGIERVEWHGGVTAATIEQLPLPSLESAFVIDLTGVTSVDSTGLGRMLRVVRQAWAADVAGCYLAPSPAVRELVRVTRLDRVLPMARDMEEAGKILAHDAVLAKSRPSGVALGGVLSYKIPLRLTSANAELCDQAIRTEWDSRADIKGLELDFSETIFMDSTGLGFLIRIQRRVAQREGGRLRMVHMNGNIKNVIQVARLENLITGGQP